MFLIVRAICLWGKIDRQKQKHYYECRRLNCGAPRREPDREPLDHQKDRQPTAQCGKEVSRSQEPDVISTEPHMTSQNREDKIECGNAQ